MRRIRAVFTAVLIALAPACDSDSPPTAPISANPDLASARLLALAGGPRTIDVDFETIAAKTPTFGGAFLNSSGELVIVTKSEAKVSDSRVAVENLLRERERSVPGSVRTIIGDYGFSELSAFRRALSVLLTWDHVIYSDVDEVRNRVVVAIIDKADRVAIEDEIVRLGVPKEAVVLEVTAPIERLSILGDHVRPLGAGLQTLSRSSGSPFHTCSMGFIARRLGWQFGFVTNSHCTGVTGGVEGTDFYQNDNSDPSFHIGVEELDPNYIGLPGCPPSSFCRWSDSAFIRFGSVWFDPGSIKKTSGLGSTTIAGSWSVTGEASYPLSGEILNKVGRASGWTQGPVTSTCVDFAGTQQDDGLLCQDIVAADIEGTDSGSPVFAISGSDATLFGVAWGGGSGQFIFSAMGNIEQELGNLETSF